jgi:hypothetical protein
MDSRLIRLEDIHVLPIHESSDGDYQKRGIVTSELPRLHEALPSNSISPSCSCQWVFWMSLASRHHSRPPFTEYSFLSGIVLSTRQQTQDC